ncbi:MAG TPA: cell wall hydrolase [Candidatus Methylomirabilis sp.]|nr:cell wall hydrolase [Candidatus Methylomirabilis sp.]
MHKKRLSKVRSHRRASWLSRVWQNLSLRWHATGKGPLIVVGAIGLVFATFGYVMYAVSAQQDDIRNLTCLALNVYFEARGEPVAGQYAVAEVTMNRVASGRYPDTVCGVVNQKNWDPIRRRYVSAFSWTELTPMPEPSGEEWDRAWEIAEAVYYGPRAPALDNALLYHARHIKPSWARGRTPVARIGNHVFYR